jgi:Domain of unknown function (DUF4386)
MNPTNRTARIAGALYAVICFTAPFSLLYVPGKVFVRGDAAATAKNILANETLFRLGLVGSLISTTAFLFLAMVLYRLLHRVSSWRAAIMTVLVLVSIPLSLFLIASEFGALRLLLAAKPQAEALAMSLIALRGAGIIVVQILWGIWLIPFGLLVMRSGFIPRILGILLVVNGIAYPLISLTALLLPQYTGLVDKVMFPAKLGELWIMLWLLIKGAQVEPV